MDLHRRTNVSFLFANGELSKNICIKKKGLLYIIIGCEFIQATIKKKEADTYWTGQENSIPLLKISMKYQFGLEFKV